MACVLRRNSTAFQMGTVPSLTVSAPPSEVLVALPPPFLTTILIRSVSPSRILLSSPRQHVTAPYTHPTLGP